MALTTIRLIDRGGFGRVDKVRDDNDNVYARKSFDPHEDFDSHDLDKLKIRFKREVKTQGALSSDYFMPIVESDLNSTTPWFTMPLADMNFQQKIIESKYRNIGLEKDLADIINAIEALHMLEYVHRDIKPSNILLHDGKWKLTDFGLCLPPSSLVSNQLSSSGSSWGSQDYCAPEQRKNFKWATSAVDIYAFGCILHDIFDGENRIPFQKHTCNGPMGVIIEKCTEVDPKRRFKSMAAVRSALQSITLDSEVLVANAPSTQWEEQLTSIDNWDINKLNEFINHIFNKENEHEKGVVFHSIDEPAITKIFQLDPEIFSQFAIEYCEWVKDSSFRFEFCDVLIGRLEHIFGLGGLECKAASAIAAARLGSYHNRWHVMGRVIAMCGQQLNIEVARRIAVEIMADEAEPSFYKCAHTLDKDLSCYHQLIRNTLSTEQL